MMIQPTKWNTYNDEATKLYCFIIKKRGSHRITDAIGVGIIVSEDLSNCFIKLIET